MLRLHNDVKQGCSCSIHKLPAVVKHGKEMYHPQIEFYKEQWTVRYITVFHEDPPLVTYWGENLEKVIDKVLEILREYTC